jgi:hypothetical protein
MVPTASGVAKFRPSYAASLPLLVDCRLYDGYVNGPYWFSGKFGFVLKNARKSGFTPLKGKLGFFWVD